MTILLIPTGDPIRPYHFETHYVRDANYGAIISAGGALTVTQRLHSVTEDAGAVGYDTVVSILKNSAQAGDQLVLERSGAAAMSLEIRPADGNVRTETGQSVWLDNANDVVVLECTIGGSGNAAVWTVKEHTSVAKAPFAVEITGGVIDGRLKDFLVLDGEAGAADDLDTISNGVVGMKLLLRRQGGAPDLYITHGPVSGGNIRTPHGQFLGLLNDGDWAELVFNGAVWVVKDYAVISETSRVIDPLPAANTLWGYQARLQEVNVAGGGLFMVNTIVGVAVGMDLYIRVGGTTRLQFDPSGNIALPLDQSFQLLHIGDVAHFQCAGAFWTLVSVQRQGIDPVAEAVAPGNTIDYQGGEDKLITSGGVHINVITGDASGATLTLYFADETTINAVGGPGSIVTPDGQSLIFQVGDTCALTYSDANDVWHVTAYSIALPYRPAGEPCAPIGTWIVFQMIEPFQLTTLTGTLIADIPLYYIPLPAGAEVEDIVVQNHTPWVGGPTTATQTLSTFNCAVGTTASTNGVRQNVDLVPAPGRLYGVRGNGIDFSGGAAVPSAHLVMAGGVGLTGFDQLTAGRTDFYVLYKILPIL